MKGEPLVSSKLQEEIYGDGFLRESVETIKTNRLTELVEEIVGTG